MRGTRLYQQAGSPLIGGSSRTRRPLALHVVLATFVAAAVSAGLLALYLAPEIETLTPRSVAVPAALLVSGSAAGSVAVSWFVAKMGSKAPWLAGAVGGVLTAWAALGLYLFLAN